MYSYAGEHDRFERGRTTCTLLYDKLAFEIAVTDQPAFEKIAPWS
jgi:hypothetical protein